MWTRSQDLLQYVLLAVLCPGIAWDPVQAFRHFCCCGVGFVGGSVLILLDKFVLLV